MGNSVLSRREFLQRSINVGGAASLAGVGNCSESTQPDSKCTSTLEEPTSSCHPFSGIYRGENLNQIAFPMGGMGAGMICLEGSGALSKFSLRQGECASEKRVFAAVAFKGPKTAARILEGPVPRWKLRPQFPGLDGQTCWGLPRFHAARFQAAFPFASVYLTDNELPLEVTIAGWSPFFPNDVDNASLPVAGLEYEFLNRSDSTIEAVFSFNAENFLAEPEPSPDDPRAEPLDRILPIASGFVLYGAGNKARPWNEGSCAAWVDNAKAEVDYAWPLDSLAQFWRQFSEGEVRPRPPLPDRPAAGGSILVPFTLGPGKTTTIAVRLAWYVANSNLYAPTKGLREGKFVAYPTPAEHYRPWYTARFKDIGAVVKYWQENYGPLRQSAQLFSKTFHDCTLSPEVLEAISANLSILKSPTVLRQRDGRLWGWEGSVLGSPEEDETGISGTTTHVWNYAQTFAHLFPKLERGLRETEFGPDQNEEGLQYCRTPLPIRPVEPAHTFPDGPAADGQLGGILKVYREWRISGDTNWLRRLWPKVRASLDYCIRTWDPEHRGRIEEPHLTTYDMEFWGADSYCTSLYLGALKAGILISNALEQPVSLYVELLRKGRTQMETQLFNGEFFVQNTEWKHLRTTFPSPNNPWTELYSKSPDWRELRDNEGPVGQYGPGCLSDGVMGEWLCLMSGVEPVLDLQKVRSHLTAVHRYNLKKDLTDHGNFVRATFACGEESGLLLCSWPRGGRPSVPMLYSDEVWTGVEYQVASHLIALGQIEAGTNIVKAVRKRYDGRTRNPFSEIEQGEWYARAMSSYGLLQAFSGARFDAVEQVLHLNPSIRGDFRCFISTATGFGTVGVRKGEPFVEVAHGEIPYRKIDYVAAPRGL